MVTKKFKGKCKGRKIGKKVEENKKNKKGVKSNKNRGTKSFKYICKFP